MVNIEQLWKDYMNFEQNINPIIAEKMAMERSRDYMSARRVAKEFEAVTRGLNRNSPSVPPTGHPEELRQVYYSLVLAEIEMVLLSKLQSVMK
jgi:cleavage stimulation factor subunit 3